MEDPELRAPVARVGKGGVGASFLVLQFWGLRILSGREKPSGELHGTGNQMTMTLSVDFSMDTTWIADSVRLQRSASYLGVLYFVGLNRNGNRSD